jgi:hypothetical protein
MRRLGASGSVALVCGALAAALAAHGARALPRTAPLEELSYYPSGLALRPAVLGHAPLAADLAWLRAVQYYGEHRRTDNRFDRMYHVFDILTTLMPAFESAYVFGGFSLAQEGGDFPRAEALMLKGIERNPRSARLAFELGFLHYVRPGGRNLPQAAEWFERASHLPGAPPSARTFAAYARQHTGDLGVARALWVTVRDGSPNAYLREMAVREIEKIDEALRRGDRSLAVRKLTTPAVLVAAEEPAAGAAR